MLPSLPVHTIHNYEGLVLVGVPLFNYNSHQLNIVNKIIPLLSLELTSEPLNVTKKGKQCKGINYVNNNKIPDKYTYIAMPRHETV